RFYSETRRFLPPIPAHSALSPAGSPLIRCGPEPIFGVSPGRPGASPPRGGVSAPILGGSAVIPAVSALISRGDEPIFGVYEVIFAKDESRLRFRDRPFVGRGLRTFLIATKARRFRMRAAVPSCNPTTTTGRSMAFYDSGATYDSGIHYDEAVAPIPKKKMAKVKLELIKKKDAEVVSLANAHKAAMTGNANFTTPIPAAAAFDTGITNMSNALAALAAARTAVATAMTNKESARNALEALLTQRGDYVDLTSLGDEAKIESSGFSVRSAPAPVGDLPAPGNLVSTTGDNEGEIDLGWNPVRGAGSYEVQCKVNDGTSQFAPVKTVTGSSLKATGLTPGSVYAFRVRAVGAAGPGAWSDQNIRRSP
ncbi:MAG: fibronectin type III domain-containing protein, partial [Chthoniobacteraceae bacterium]